MAEQYFMGLDGFIWFVGVVESRNDPAQLGRVQVRCLGYHTADKNLIPTADLPWAHVMHPVTDPSMQGLGNSPSFLVEGSWVVGFFRDAREKQQPIIMGSLPGYPDNPPDPSLGFNDPTSTYPSEDRIYSNHGIKESDVSRLARGAESEEHEGLKLRRRLKQDDIPIATKPHIPTVSDSSTAEERTTWNEPHPKSISITAPTGQTTLQRFLAAEGAAEAETSIPDPYPSATYPYNHVFESEAGHIQEIDDTPGGERLMQQHKSGSFTEIHPDGSKVVKVIGNNYEIIAGTTEVFINGNVSLTMAGNVRELIKGDYVLEVEGNFTQNIHGESEIKIGKNKAEEIVGNHAFNINSAIKGRVGEDFDLLIN